MLWDHNSAVRHEQSIWYSSVKEFNGKAKSRLDPNELQMINILLKSLKLNVRNGQGMADKITTNIGVPQGGCLSPILSTLYLADALKTKRSTITEHNHSKVPTTTEDVLLQCLKDHTYSLSKEDGLLIDQQYVDDTSWVAINAKQRTEKKIKQKFQSSWRNIIYDLTNPNRRIQH